MQATETRLSQLPLKNLGQLTLDSLIEETMPVKTQYLTLVQEKQEKSVSIDLTIGNIKINGNIDNVFEDQYIACSFSKSSQKNLVRAYIRALLLRAQEEITSAILIDKAGGIISILLDSAEESKIKLNALMAYLNKGCQAPFKFTLEAASEALKEDADVKKIVNVFRNESIGNSNSGVSSNKYMQILFEQGFFDDLNEDDLEEIKNIATLLNMKTN